MLSRIKRFFIDEPPVLDEVPVDNISLLVDALNYGDNNTVCKLNYLFTVLCEDTERIIIYCYPLYPTSASVDEVLFVIKDLLNLKHDMETHRSLRHTQTHEVVVATLPFKDAVIKIKFFIKHGHH